MNISKHITLSEATKSQQAVRMGLANQPAPEHLEAMRHVAENIFERARAHFGVPIAITSFYRSYALNKAIGGSATSQHCLGQAIDMDADVLGGLTNAQLFHYIKNNLDFDQLIWEYGNSEQPDWVHASLKMGLNRRQILVVKKVSGKTVTEKWRE